MAGVQEEACNLSFACHGGCYNLQHGVCMSNSSKTPRRCSRTHPFSFSNALQ